MKKPNVLLYVDDSESIGELVKRFFDKQHPDYEFIVVDSSSSAWEELERRRGTDKFPKAVITDFRLNAGENGPALVARLRLEFPNLRTIIVSAMLSPRDVEQAHAAGADAVVEKDLSARDFASRLFDLTDCPTDTLSRMVPAL